MTTPVFWRYGVLCGNGRGLKINPVDLVVSAYPGWKPLRALLAAIAVDDFKPRALVADLSEVVRALPNAERFAGLDRAVGCRFGAPLAADIVIVVQVEDADIPVAGVCDIDLDIATAPAENARRYLVDRPTIDSNTDTG